MEGSGSHRYYEDLAVAHVLGGLGETDSRLFRDHLLGCADCRARVGELRAIAHDLADVERSAQRERSARVLDTKRRTGDDGEAPEPPARGRSRLQPVVALLFLAALVGVIAWKVRLRATTSGVEEQLRRSQEAAAILEFGTDGTIVSVGAGVSGRVAVRDDRLVVLIDGLDDNQVYGLYLQDPGGVTVFRHPIQSLDGRALSWLEFPEGAATVLGTSGGSMPGAEPSGSTVLHARLP
jgi:hypothetical protein